MSDEELIHHYATKVSKGEITFDKVRPQLEQQGFEETRIKQIVRRVDDEVQAALVRQSTASSLDNAIRFGIALIVIGVIVVLGSLTRFFSASNNYMVVFAYGPIVAGLVLVVMGIRRKKNKGSAPSHLNRTFRVRDRKNHDDAANS